MYVIARIDTEYGFGGIEKKSIHIYSRQSKTRESLFWYYMEIKDKYPNRKVVLTTIEKAKEVDKKCREYYADQERKAMGLKPRMTIGELNKKYFYTLVE